MDNMKENVSIFLLSGLLEEYAMGLTSEDQNREVEKYIKEYDEVRIEYERIQKVFEEHAKEIAVSPPDNVRTVLTDPSTYQNLRESTLLPSRWPIAASVAAALFAFASLFLLQQSNQLKNELAGTEAQFQVYKEECEAEQKTQQSLNARFAFISDPQTKAHMIKGNTLLPSSASIAYWNNEKGEGHLHLVDMPAPPDKHCYQIWADVEGKMIPIGILPKNEEWLELKFLANAESLNITIEPDGGSDHPNVERLIGNAFI